MSENRPTTRTIVPGLAVIAVMASSVAAAMFWSSNGMEVIHEFIGRASGSMMVTSFAKGPRGVGPAEGGSSTNSTGKGHQSALSPDATNGKVVFQKGSNSSSNIYLITPGSGVSLGLRRGFHPAFSPDGTKIAFVDNTAGATDGFIRLMNADGTNVRNLAQPRQGFSPTWSPDGTRLAFVKGDFESVGDDGKGELYIIDMAAGSEGANEVLIPTTIQVSRPSWGSNNRIVFAGMRPRQGGGNESLGIHVTGTIPASGQIASNPPAITAISGTNVNDRDPAWSSDGTQIAFLSMRDYPMFSGSDIYAMDAQGNNVRRVTNASSFKSAPAWAPDGTKIVYSRAGSMGSLNANLAMVNADGSNGTSPVLVTNFSSGDSYPNWGSIAPAVTNGNIYFGDGPITSSNIISFNPLAGAFGEGANLGRGYHPAVSPDGTTVAFVDNTAGATNNQIMLMNSNGTNRRPLPHPATGFTPTWSPDGKRLAYVVGNFVSGENGSGSIWVMDMVSGSEGANQTVIPNTQNSSNPKWGPNNFILYFSRQSPNPGVGISKLGPVPATSQITSNPPPASRLAGAEPNDREADWSSDGTKIAFRSFRDDPTFSSSEIYIMTSNGTGATRLTNETTSKANPIWAPDGSSIAYDSGQTSLRHVKPDGSDGASPPALKFSTARFPDWGAASTSPPGGVVDLYLTAGGPTQIVEGDSAQYVVNLVNRNAPTPATGVKIVTDPLPAFVQFVTAGTSNTCSLGTDRKVTCNIGTVVLDTGSTIINLKPSQTGSFTFKATVTSNESEPTPDPHPNSASIAITVTPSADMGLTLLESPPAKVDLGQNITYRYFITNHGPSPASGVVFRDNFLPSNVEFVPSLSTSLFGCRLLSGSVLCDDFGIIEKGSSRTITVVVRTIATGNANHFGSVSVSGATDKNASNNTASVSTLVESPRVDLEILATAPTESALGDNVTFTVRVKNHGPSPATNVVLRNDRTAANSSFVSVSGPGCTNFLGVTTCSIGNLAAGETTGSISLTVQPRTIEPISLHFTASSSQMELSPDPHPNTATVVTKIVVRMEVMGLEVTQAVQDLKNSVPLIRGKRTYIRAYVKGPALAVGNWTFAKATLIGTNNADGVSRSLTPSNPGGMIKLINNPDRGQINDSFYFELPDSWTSAGTLQFRIESDQPLTCSEPDGTPNCATSVVFNNTPSVLDVRFYALGYKSGNNNVRPSNRDIDQVVDEFRAIFPTPYLKYDSYDWTTPSGVNKPTNADEFNKVNDQLLTQFKLDCRNKSSVCSKQYVGLLINPSGSILGMANDIPGDVCSTYIDGTLTPGHEIGHSLGLKHTNYNGRRGLTPREPGPGTHTPSDGTISSKKEMYGPNTIYGFDTYNTGDYLASKPGRVYGPDTPDFMGYAAARPWISEHSYARMLSKIQGISGSDPSNFTLEANDAVRETVDADDIIVVSGTLPIAGEALPQFSSIYIINSPGPVELPPTGTYAIRLEGGAGQILATYPFEPDVPNGESDVLTFNLMLPWDTNARKITVLKDGQPILSRSASTNKPKITVTSPNGGETFSGDTAQLQWNTTDADGDDLEYLVQFSDDGGATWRVLIANLAANSYELDLNSIGGTSQGLVRVTASDGFNTAQDQSDAVFTVTPHPPRASISSPANDSLFVGDQNIHLQGGSYDAEDGTLPESGLTWSSNLNGTLGTGSSLAVDASTLQEGAHTITLSATDSSSQSGSTSVTIQVFRTRPVLPATLSAGPTVLGFIANLGSEATDPQAVSIRNSGDGDLMWSAAADQPWIKLASTTGTAPSNADVIIDATGLEIGNYSGKITITTTDAANGPQEVNVDLAVVQGPPLRAEGRVLTSTGRGLGNAAVSILDVSDGTVRKTFTNALGFFTFSDLPSGKSYTIQITSKRYRFFPRTMVLADDITLADFIGLE